MISTKIDAMRLFAMAAAMGGMLPTKQRVVRDVAHHIEIDTEVTDKVIEQSRAKQAEKQRRRELRMSKK